MWEGWVIRGGCHGSFLSSMPGYEIGYNKLNWIQDHAARIRAFKACFSLSFMIVRPTKRPIPVSPTTRRNAGNLTAHSRGGKKEWIGLDVAKKG
jgi:hypothetical protein